MRCYRYRDKKISKTGQHKKRKKKEIESHIATMDETQRFENKKKEKKSSKFSCFNALRRQVTIIGSFYNNASPNICLNVFLRSASHLSHIQVTWLSINSSVGNRSKIYEHVVYSLLQAEKKGTSSSPQKAFHSFQFSRAITLEVRGAVSLNLQQTIGPPALFFLRQRDREREKKKDINLYSFNYINYSSTAD